MFRGCVSFVAANVSEAHYLVEWMKIWGLDLHRLDDMENMNPVDTIVRFSLDLGVQAVIVFRTDDKYFVKGKRVLWAIPGQLRWSSTAYVKGLQNSSQTKVVALSPSHVRAKIIQRLRDFTLPLLRLRGHRYAAIKERKVGFTAFWQRRWQTAHKLIVYLCLTGDTRAAAVVEHDIGIKERKAGFTAFWQRRQQTAHKLIVYLCLTGDTRAAAVVEHDIGQGTAELKPS
ncbi:hypothetical protein MRX96_052899 [Rhipicephalus microplus]